MTMRNTTGERAFDTFVDSPTRTDKSAIEVVSSQTLGPLDVPMLTDFISGTNSGSNFIIQYKAGGSGGTVLKTLTFNKLGCPFELVIS